jgi:hypothetical protein
MMPTAKCCRNPGGLEDDTSKIVKKISAIMK